MKPSAIRIERILEKIEAALVPPPRKWLQVSVYEAVENKERALAELAARTPDAFAGRAVEDINWSDDMAAAQAKALAEHIATHPEDLGRTVADFDWIVREFVLRPQELIEDEHTVKDTDGPSETLEPIETPTLEPIDLPPPDPPCLARSKPWRPVHQRPARDQRRVNGDPARPR